ncbi:hypothetical protein ACFY9F_09630 [Streptomyces sp. NPDC012421]|uniref:hypothetical protein n=1 Tax=unclassified Streptomyces TaxID=2593676 RepID=UPI0036C8A7E1
MPSSPRSSDRPVPTRHTPRRKENRRAHPAPSPPPSAPTAAQHAATTGRTEVVGSCSGAGAPLQGLIAATTKKDTGLAEPLSDAFDEVIENLPRTNKQTRHEGGFA